jgi:uncharacterized protein YjiS (DUF1127 family)
MVRSVGYAHLGLLNPLNLLGFIRKRLRERRELNYLLNLPDYQLNDIGLRRSDIEHEAMKPIWREDQP